MKELVLTIGLPRSGKTTWAKKQGHPIVNRDAIRLALHGHRFLSEAEPMVTVLEENMVKSLFLAGHKVVIVDATHNTHKRRKRWLEMFPDAEVAVRMVPFETDEKTCIKRAKKENDPEIIPIIRKMAEEADWGMGGVGMGAYFISPDDFQKYFSAA